MTGQEPLIYRCFILPSWKKVQTFLIQMSCTEKKTAHQANHASNLIKMIDFNTLIFSWPFLASWNEWITSLVSWTNATIPAYLNKHSLSEIGANHFLTSTSSWKHVWSWLQSFFNCLSLPGLSSLLEQVRHVRSHCSNQATFSACPSLHADEDRMGRHTYTGSNRKGKVACRNLGVTFPEFVQRIYGLANQPEDYNTHIQDWNQKA